jgi:hypothetical protein
LIPFDEFPGLAAVIEGPDGSRLASEVARLLGGRLKTRADRRRLKRIARLSCTGYDEVVLVKDVSATGIRFLIRSDEPLDIRRTLDMRLTVQLPSGRCSFSVALVRVCGREGEQIDLGCRFLDLAPEQQRSILDMRNHVFGD